MSDLVKAENNNALQASGTTSRAPAALASDLIIPKALLMQPLSDFVNDGKATAGQIVRSTTGEKLGGKDEPVELIPLTIQNLWMNQESIAGKLEFRGYEPRTAVNENLEWDYSKNGTMWKRTKVLNLFALLPKDVQAFQDELARAEADGDMPDLDKVILPVVVPFRSTSFQAGRTVATLFMKADSLAQELGRPVPVYGKTVLLSCYLEKGDKGAYWVYTVDAKGKATDKAFTKTAARWYQDLQAMGMQVKVDEADVAEVVSTETGPTSF